MEQPVMSNSEAFQSLLGRNERSSKKTTLDEEWISWLHGLAGWTHAATFTCKRHSTGLKPINEKILSDAARHLIQRINNRCFGKSSRRGKSVPVVVTFGWGVYEDHPHLHFSFEAPAHLSYEEFSSILEDSANRTYWIDRQRRIKPYANAGWGKYLIEHGTDQLIAPCITPSASYQA
jgi:hypothetical protein